MKKIFFIGTVSMTLIAVGCTNANNGTTVTTKDTIVKKDTGSIKDTIVKNPDAMSDPH